MDTLGVFCKCCHIPFVSIWNQKRSFSSEGNGKQQHWSHRTFSRFVSIEYDRLSTRQCKRRRNVWSWHANLHSLNVIGTSIVWFSMHATIVTHGNKSKHWTDLFQRIRFFFCAANSINPTIIITHGIITTNIEYHTERTNCHLAVANTEKSSFPFCKLNRINDDGTY